MSKVNHLKIRAEIFEIATISRFLLQSTKKKNLRKNKQDFHQKKIIINSKNDEFGYFNILSNI